jgi:hypothetical protein
LALGWALHGINTRPLPFSNPSKKHGWRVVALFVHMATNIIASLSLTELEEHSAAAEGAPGWEDTKHPSRMNGERMGIIAVARSGLHPNSLRQKSQ